jgi:hypothetical protein
MANPNKTVARARKAMGGFPQREPNEARKAQSAEFSAFMDWCVKQYDAGRTFTNVEAAREAYDNEKA